MGTKVWTHIGGSTGTIGPCPPRRSKEGVLPPKPWNFSSEGRNLRSAPPPPPAQQLFGPKIGRDSDNPSSPPPNGRLDPPLTTRALPNHYIANIPNAICSYLVWWVALRESELSLLKICYCLLVLKNYMSCSKIVHTEFGQHILHLWSMCFSYRPHQRRRYTHKILVMPLNLAPIY